MRLELMARSPEDTVAVGEAVASLLQEGDAIALTGELGAGKTTFVRGAARALGFDGAVASPTFTLVREYRGRVRIYHVDVYRLERVQEVLDLGLDEMVAEGGLLLVEWGDAVEGLLPDEHLLVEITLVGGEDARRIVVTGQGPSWATRWERLERLTELWGTAA
ncbi:MAG TPA: tRNA (adenosine(37)-N6)-threonylcarbamoyltransferase complex ATPase subunit type 1 TsaE [Actinomycetota bacterium]|nr:tRNA (adenosine(37)-N6)-threonylcarbamoyltransferase complex ATPase subunit type 1 TsaE [Actinomycetota bacterium]